MGDGLDLALVQQERSLEKRLAVAGGAGVDDLRLRIHALPDFLHRADGGGQRGAVIVRVELVEQGTVLVHQGDLRGGGAGVDAEEDISLVALEVRGLYRVARMPRFEGVILGLVFEERGQTGDLVVHLHALLQGRDQLFDVPGLRRFLTRHLQLCVHGGADGREQVGVFRGDDVFPGQLQRADKGIPELRQEVQGAAEKRHVAADRLSAGEARDGLVHHRLEDGGGQILAGRALVDQRLDVRLREHAAARRDGIDSFVVFRVIVQTGSVRLQEGRHLVDEGTGAAGADAVHPLVDAAGEIDDLGVLAAQLDSHVGLRREGLQRRRHGHDLLDKGDLQVLCQRKAAGTGDHRDQLHRAEDLFRFLEKARQGLLDVREMSLIIGKENVPLLIQDGHLYGGGADIDAKRQPGLVFSSAFVHIYFENLRSCRVHKQTGGSLRHGLILTYGGFKFNRHIPGVCPTPGNAGEEPGPVRRKRNRFFSQRRNCGIIESAVDFYTAVLF